MGLVTSHGLVELDALTVLRGAQGIAQHFDSNCNRKRDTACNPHSAVHTECDENGFKTKSGQSELRVLHSSGWQEAGRKGHTLGLAPHVAEYTPKQLNAPGPASGFASARKTPEVERLTTTPAAHLSTLNGPVLIFRFLPNTHHRRR